MSLRLQAHDITVVYKSGHKHDDANCLSRAPVESSSSDQKLDYPFLGALNVSKMARLQRMNPELFLLIRYLEGQQIEVARV